MHGALAFFEVTLTVSLIQVQQKKKKKPWLDTELQYGRALSTKIRLWLCKLGMQEGIYKLHML